MPYHGRESLGLMAIAFLFRWIEQGQQLPPSVLVRLVCASFVPIGIDGALARAHLEVLVADQGPRAAVLGLESQRSLKVHDGTRVVGLDAVVVADDEARLGPVLVDLDRVLRQHRQHGALLGDVQNVAVVVEALEPERIRLAQLFVQARRLVVLAQMEQRERRLALDVRAREGRVQALESLLALWRQLQLDLTAGTKELEHVVEGCLRDLNGSKRVRYEMRDGWLL